MSYYSDLELAIEGLGTGEKNTAAEVRVILRRMLKGLSLEGDIRAVYMTEEEITENFENNGLGKNEREGWAICNGLNRTVDFSGAVGIGYGSSFTEIGTRVGSNSKNVSIPVTGYTVGADTDAGPSGTLIVSSGKNEDSEYLESLRKVSSATVPTTSVNVMQTSLILLYIQRI